MNTFRLFLAIVILCWLTIGDVFSQEKDIVSAVKDKNIDLVKCLLDVGADPHSKDERGNSLLEIAVRDKSFQIYRLLSDYGARFEDDEVNFLLILSAKNESLKTHIYKISGNEEYDDNPSIVRFLLKQGFDVSRDDAAIQKILKPMDEVEINALFSYLHKVKANIEEVADRKRRRYRLTDSILSLSEAERNSDPIYEYRIYDVFEVDENGHFHKVKAVEKLRRQEVFISKSVDVWAVLLLTFFFTILLSFIVYIKLRSKDIKREDVYFIILFIALSSFLSFLMIDSIYFNAAEYYTRRIGKQYEASVSYEEKKSPIKLRKMPGISYVYSYLPRMTYLNSDSIMVFVEADRSTLEVLGRDAELEKMTVCIDEENSRVAVLIPWHDKSNLFFIVANALGLILFLLLFSKMLIRYTEKKGILSGYRRNRIKKQK